MTKAESGFERPNFTATPNTLFDRLLPVMSNAELRVTLVLIRLTTGWHLVKTADALSIPELAEKGGLSPASVKTGISEGMKRGTIKRHATRDELNRRTFRYSIQFRAENGAYFNEIERPKKEASETGPDDTQSTSSSQNLAAWNRAPKKWAPSQNLAAWSGKSSSQNLAASYKEERNDLVVKEKERETPSATPPALQAPQEIPQGETSEQRNGEGTPPVQDQAHTRAAGAGHHEALETVPGGAAAAGEETTDEYLRRKFSNAFIERVFEEIQPFGVNRRVDWVALPLQRVKELALEASKTHMQFKVKVPTRMKDLLDQEVQRTGLPPIPEQAPMPLNDDGEIDMEALIAGASLNGRRNR